MKKLWMIALLSGLPFTTLAQSSGFVSSDVQPRAGGFNGPGMISSAISVAQAKTRRDDAKVVLEGNIVRQVGNELYEFRDNSGSIYVDIGDKYWVGQSVSPNDKVRIEGEIDKDWNSVEVDVNKITVIK
ncbi:TPA: YgiW/YdeI family stress tolerance OB fold protein [Escherichia coli]|nr:YgiW/YdeI family stress tolerance OB fold protein [Escherichia coli]